MICKYIFCRVYSCDKLSSNLVPNGDHLSTLKTWFDPRLRQTWIVKTVIVPLHNARKQVWVSQVVGYVNISWCHSKLSMVGNTRCFMANNAGKRFWFAAFTGNADGSIWVTISPVGRKTPNTQTHFHSLRSQGSNKSTYKAKSIDLSIMHDTNVVPRCNLSSDCVKTHVFLFSKRVSG